MEEVIEQYGIGLLQILGGGAVFKLWMDFVCQGGMLAQICMEYLDRICG